MTGRLAVGAALASRRVLRIGGEDALSLLQRVVTNDVRPLASPGAAPVYAALQNAHGRLEHDVFLHREMMSAAGGVSGALLADLPSDGFDAALALLMKLRLRAAVTLDDVGDDHAVVVAAAEDDREEGGRGTSVLPARFQFLPVDPRWVGLGRRGVLPAAAVAALLGSASPCGRGGSGGSDGGDASTSTSTSRSESESESRSIDPFDGGGDAAYRRHRYLRGVAEGTAELATRLPLECNLEGLHGVSFDKGCYIGQELTARTHFVGVVRKRLAPIAFRSVEDAAAALASGGTVHSSAAAGPSGSKRERGGVGKVVAVEGDVGLAMMRVAAIGSDARMWATVDGGGEVEIETPASAPSWWPKEWTDAAERS